MSEQHRSVVRLLRLLARNADLIAKAYTSHGNDILPTDENERTINALIRDRMAWRQEGEEAVRLKSVLVNLINHGLKNIHRVRTDVDIGGRLNEIEGLVNNYKSAQANRSYDDAQQYLGIIREQVSDLVELLAESTRSLWHQIDSKFGWLSSIDAKAKENQRVLDQSKKLLDSLDMIDRQELSGWAGPDRELCRILTWQLPIAVERCLAELSDALHRLKDMLFEFKTLQSRGRLIQYFHRQYQKAPDYVPGRLLDMFDVPEMINQAAPLLFSASPDLDDEAQEIILTKLLRHLRKEAVPVERRAETIPVMVDSLEPETIEVPLSEIRQSVNDFFESVVECGERRAMGIGESEIPCSADIWLHAVLACYESMEKQDKSIFDVRYIEKQDPVFNGVHHVSDIEVRCQM